MHTLRYLAALTVFFLNPAQAAQELHYQVDPHAVTINMPRLGINLGEWTTWGASQFFSNVIKNPGFEGLIDRAIVIVKNTDGQGFSDDTAWTKRADGFWAGARYDVRSGVAAGSQGMLFDSLAVGKQGLPEFEVKGDMPALAPGDVVSLTRVNDDELPSQWWYGNTPPLPGQLTVANNEKRPGSPGIRALALKPMAEKPVAVFSYLDAIGDRAGKLLPVNGNWKLRFWLRQTKPGAKLTVSFKRLNGGKAFFQETFQATGQWQAVERSFAAHDDGASGILELSLLAEGQDGDLLLDDMELGPISTNAGKFRPELIAALKKLRPGYLRDWQGQLGDTFANRAANSFARRASRYRPEQESTFSYSLDDFLQLAKTVGAQPWVIIPPTMGDQELQDFGHYLSGQIASRHFQEVLVEFGNENWNSVFRPAGIPDYKAHGQVAGRAFQQLLAGAAHHPAIHTIVNGQYVNPWLSAKFLDGVSTADGLAIAPYFLFKLDETDDVLAALFQQDDFYRETLAASQKRGKELLVYEVNLHTTSGNAPAVSRSIATTSAAAGAALAKRLLTGLQSGIQRQCLYTLAQYDAYFEPMPGKRDLVKLWGVMRDLGGTQRLRPTGLAMEMLNKILPADVHEVKNLDGGDQAITVTGFHNNAGWALAAVSAKPGPQQITVAVPTEAQAKPWRLLRLDSPAPTADNEDKENVRIVGLPLKAENGRISLSIPAYGFVIALQ